ncbi:TPR-like protein [Coniophora puteana RWD-64-598 SS2]|uniref:ER membrane protein complex subunit 2 n=1 Tax=Coniophora puteana (strain RWD-64-598) TaxID=741705 RepID=A0A5M3MLR5_CONPW|nr:TPR-like protein [Coniophora puteana RWD-64-598 SS2]EIW79724.1 TPR-like protein [Coniophora puteana RWD-64-598 SS2]
MTTTAALEQLATYRAHNSRASQETFQKGLPLFQRNAYKKMGDDAWSFLEQLALASIDMGRYDIADQCLKVLEERFTGSPRVDCLHGILMEATESPEIALKYYNDLLEADSANAPIWKRQIAVLRHMGKIEKAVNELSQFLDTFYADVEGWLELADIYATCNRYENSLQALSHVIVLAPQNPFYLLQAAETAYTAGDVPLSIRMFLMVVDMSDGDDNEPLAESTPLGITVRAWYGVKLCSRRLIRDPEHASVSASQTDTPKNVALLDELATERLRIAYSSAGKKGDIAQGRDEVFAWVAAP